MLRKWIIVFLAALLVLGAAPAAFAAPKWTAQSLPPGLAKKVKNPLEFLDCEDAPWAKAIMARMRAKNIIKGYDDGSFKPNSSVSETEAIVMVIRMKGTQTEQAAVALANQNLGIPGASAVWWATGHIAYALQQGWIDRADFQPNKAASRAWVARLLVKAMVSDWQTQVQAHANDALPLKDASHINRADVGFIALALANKWMVGYPDGDFKPTRPVTRAEMAALLERGQASIPGTKPFEAEGTISTIDQTARTITVATYGTSLTYTVSVDALIYVEGMSTPGTLADLRVGDQFKAILNGNNVIIVLTVENRGTTPPANTTTVTGTLQAVAVSSLATNLTIRGSNSTDYVYPLAPNAALRQNGTTISTSQLVLGSTVTVTVSNGQIVTLDVGTSTGTTTVTGTIQLVENLGTYYVTVRDAAGVSFRYPLATNATVTLNGVAAVASQLAVGQTVVVTVTNSQITSCAATAQSTTTISGVIQLVENLSNVYYLTVRDAASVNFRYPLATNATVTLNGVAAVASQLAVGQTVVVTVVNGQITTCAATAQSTTTISGAIQLVENLSNVYYLTVRDAASVNFRYPLATNATITLNGVAAVASQLAVGQTVTVTVVNGQITTCAATGQTTTTISGAVVSVNLSASPRTITLAVQNTTGTTSVTYALSADCRAYYQSAEVALTTLAVGDRLTVTKVGDLVTSITVTEKAQTTTQINGTLQAIETGTTTYLTVRDSASVNFRYQLASNATLTSGSVAITVSQLTTGLTVHITVVNGQITTLQVVVP